MFRWLEVCGVRPAVMGVVNVTPDSFSDGGRYLDAGAAVAHGLELVAAGADLLDVGGESTRPGAEPVPEAEERRRVLPVVEGLAAAGVPVSIDTTKAAVAAAAIEAGATVVNDVSAGRREPEILAVAADAGAGYVVMHMLGEPRTMQRDPRYDDVVADVRDFLLERLEVARAAGIGPGALAADPGIGFGKTVAHNLSLLAALPELASHTGVPVVVGTSRKSFLSRLLGGDNSLDARDDATLATVVWAVDHGARVVRVHNAGAAVRAIRLLDVMQGCAA
ncbi:MAG TPA: dihydropteroate synthase [Acidimicrobiia bacterium]|nr:dihydropteroate synthase [Acidimicrobiia bacterium]